jgi:predicted small lipoprotein YifL
MSCGQEGPLYLPTNKPPITEAPVKKQPIIQHDVPTKNTPAKINTPPNLIKEL